ncbi:MAG: 2'-5' RNA ligase family protein [Chloroflexi bacterium]|nr:2'-5' RNA ligase family protein [Chloroflexota bacterium]
MTAGQAELKALHDELLTGVLGSLAEQERSYQPYVVFGRVPNSADLAEAKKALKGFEPQFNFRVSQMALWQRAEVGQPWRPEMKFSLKATVAGRARRGRVEG